VVTHDAPASFDDRPTLLKISESADWQRDAAAPIGLERVRQKDAGAEQAEYCCNRFDHRRCPYAPPAPHRMRGYTVKTILNGTENRNLGDDFRQQPAPRTRLSDLLRVARSGKNPRHKSSAAFRVMIGVVWLLGPDSNQRPTG
jgi:hypothetical protein